MRVFFLTKKNMIKNTLIVIIIGALLLMVWTIQRPGTAASSSIRRLYKHKKRVVMNIMSQEDDNDEEEKYITYLPHSGLHNQRIALINALILAKALNRTLLIPELNIGSATLWSPSNVLSRQISSCPSLIKQRKRKLMLALRCHNYRKYKPVPMESIFDLTTAHQLGIRTEARKDMKRDYIKRHAILNGKVPVKYSMNDPVRYSYQIHDHDPVTWQPRPEDGDIERYSYHIDLASLRSRPEPYIEFGSLFGMTRLILREPELVWIKEYLHRTTAISHPNINEESQRIQEALDHDYTSIHLRQGDGVFKGMVEETIHEIERTLNEKLLSMSYTVDNDQQRQIKLKKKMTEDDVLFQAQLVTQSLLSQPNKSTQERLEICRSVKDLHIPKLEIIYLATDASRPRRQFSQLFEHYPCIFILSDFYNLRNNSNSAKKKRTNNSSKGSTAAASIKRLLLPMIDAEIASHAKLFIGTPKSTYSAYVRYRNQHYRTLDFFTQ
ncbi:MAG: hypothetical protein EXX96DRAFT_363145 [Benjaminiella poitrasii]|nr:MAG: hypothetical protein EXX96DRAFT_363145 [Benjaminiella poitrasii]